MAIAAAVNASIFCQAERRRQRAGRPRIGTSANVVERIYKILKVIKMTSFEAGQRAPLPGEAASLTGRAKRKAASCDTAFLSTWTRKGVGGVLPTRSTRYLTECSNRDHSVRPMRHSKSHLKFILYRRTRPARRLPEPVRAPIPLQCLSLPFGWS